MQPTTSTTKAFLSQQAQGKQPYPKGKVFVVRRETSTELSGNPVNPSPLKTTESAWKNLLPLGIQLSMHSFELGINEMFKDSKAIPYYPTNQERSEGFLRSFTYKSACILVTKNHLGLNYFKGDIIRMDSFHRGYKWFFTGSNLKDNSTELSIHLSCNKPSAESLPKTNSLIPHITYTSRIGLIDTKVLVIPQGKSEETEAFKKIALSHTITLLANETTLHIPQPNPPLLSFPVSLPGTMRHRAPIQVFLPLNINEIVAQLTILRFGMTDSSFTACLKSCLQSLNKTQMTNLKQHLKDLCTRGVTVTENCKPVLETIELVIHGILEEEKDLKELQGGISSAEPLSQTPESSASVSEPSPVSAAASSSGKAELTAVVATSLPLAPLILPSVSTERADTKKDKQKATFTFPRVTMGTAFFSARNRQKASVPDELGVALLDKN